MPAITSNLNSMGLSMHIALPFTALFVDEEPKSLGEYFEGIGQETLLKISPFFLSFNINNSKYSNVYSFLQMFFTKGNEEIYTYLVNNLEKYLDENGFSIDEVEIPYVVSSLRFFEFVFDNVPVRPDELSVHEIEINILKAYLLINEIVTHKSGEISSETTTHLSDELRSSGIFLALQLHNFDLTNYRLDNLFATQLIRAIMFFEFLESREDCKVLLEEFYKYFGVEDYKHYFKLILPLCFAVIMNSKEVHTDLKIDEDINGNGILDKLTVSDNEILEAFDFKNLRSKPLHKISDNIYRIISPQFTIELLYNGLYWKFKYIYDLLEKKDRPKDLYLLKTYEFSEKFVLNKVLKKYFGKRYFQKSGDELEQEYDGAPDYYMRNGNRIFLFESKDIMLNAEVKQTFDFHVICEEMQKKLYMNENGKPKAVLQIINNIKRILNEQLNFDKGFRGKNVKVYPILVLHYRMFNVGGFNKIIDSWFQNELETLKNDGFNISNIKPLIIIDVDTLIFYQDLFANRKLDFEDCLNEYIYSYIDFYSQKSKRIFKSQEDLLQALRNSILPFAHYLDEKVITQKIRTLPNELLLKALGLFEEKEE